VLFHIDQAVPSRIANGLKTTAIIADRNRQQIICEFDGNYNFCSPRMFNHVMGPALCTAMLML